MSLAPKFKDVCYEISVLSATVVEVRDLRSGKSVQPSCGHDALHTYEFLRNSRRHGEEVAQSFLAQIIEGKKPVTEMIDSINSFRDSNQSENLRMNFRA